MSMQLRSIIVDAPVYYCATVNNTERRSTLDDEAHSSFHSRRALSVSSFQGEAQPLITHLIRAIRDYMANVAAYDERRETRRASIIATFPSARVPHKTNASHVYLSASTHRSFLLFS